MMMMMKVIFFFNGDDAARKGDGKNDDDDESMMMKAVMMMEMKMIVMMNAESDVGNRWLIIYDEWWCWWRWWLRTGKVYVEDGLTTNDDDVDDGTVEDKDVNNLS